MAQNLSNEIQEDLKLLMDLFKPTNLIAFGVFEWEPIAIKNGRKRKTYTRKILVTFNVENTKSSESWFIRRTENTLELIIDFRLNNLLMGEITLYEFTRNGNGLKQVKSKILSMR